MKAVTTIKVTYNVPNKINEQAQDIIEGRILSVQMYPSVSVVYQYNVQGGAMLLNGVKNIDNATADAILGTNPIDSMSKAEEVFYGTLKAEMASTFGLELNQIVIE